MKKYVFDCGGNSCDCGKVEKKKIHYGKIFFGSVALGIVIYTVWIDYQGKKGVGEVKTGQVGKSIDCCFE